MTDHLDNYKDQFYDTALEIASAIDENVSGVEPAEYEIAINSILSNYFTEDQITEPMMVKGMLCGCLTDELDYSKYAFGDRVNPLVPDSTGYADSVDDAVFNLTKDIGSDLHPVNSLMERVDVINRILDDYRLPWDNAEALSDELRGKAENVLVNLMNWEKAFADLLGSIWYVLTKVNVEEPKINLKISNDNPVVIPTPTHITKPNLKLVN